MNQKNNHINPIAPVIIYAIFHPAIAPSNQTLAAIHGTNKAAIIAPTLAPLLNIPVANALSFLGNHSATVFMDAGKFPASPIPNKLLIKA